MADRVDAPEVIPPELSRWVLRSLDRDSGESTINRAVCHWNSMRVKFYSLCCLGISLVRYWRSLRLVAHM